MYFTASNLSFTTYICLNFLGNLNTPYFFIMWWKYHDFHFQNYSSFPILHGEIAVVYIALDKKSYQFKYFINFSRNVC